MRLIDADDYKSRLKCAFNGSEGSENEREYKEVIEIMLKILDMQPTAYDVDKVVEQLKEDAVYFEREANDFADKGCYGEATEFQGMSKAYKDAIEIVKSGGISD